SVHQGRAVVCRQAGIHQAEGASAQEAQGRRGLIAAWMRWPSWLPHPLAADAFDARAHAAHRPAMHAAGIRLVPRAPAAKRVGAAIAASVLACAVAGAAIAQSSAPGRQEPVPEQEPAGEAPRLGTVVVTATRQPA